MTIEFHNVTQENLAAVCALQVAPEQRELVTSNVMTMAESQFEAGALVRALWLNDHPVGLLAMLNPSRYPTDQDIIIRRDTAFVWRLMVGLEYQGQGFGMQALTEAKRIAITWGYNAMSLTVGGKTHSAIPMYEKFGLSRTGRILWDDENEIEMLCRFT